MTLAGTAQGRSPVMARTTPPWLWVWLAGYLLGTLPLMISLLHFTITTYFGRESGPLTGSGGFITVERLALIFSMLIYAAMLSGALAALFPHARGRWVEWRFKLAGDDRPVMAEMQQFVSSHDPSLSLRVTIRSDQMARLYPAGWHDARIAVFRPLPALWRRDREAAEAILLHEVAHRRQGDQLIVGLGSPFVMLMRMWAPGYLLLVLIPNAIYLASAGQGLHAMFFNSQDVTYATGIPGAVLLPVTALWLAELSADRVAGRAIGPDAVRRALQATAGARAPLAARTLALLSHPPRWLRARLAAPRRAGAAALVAVWPVALVLWLLVLPLALTAAALLLDGLAASEMGPGLKIGAHELLAYGRPLAIATALVLLAWPAAEHSWQRLWSAPLHTSQRQPWWPCLTAAVLPVALLVLSLVPIQGSGVTSLVPSAACQPFISWIDGTGATQQAAIEELLSGSAGMTAATTRQADSEIQAALDNPPPGTAGSTYAKAMTELRTAVSDQQAGDTTAGLNTEINAFGLLADMDKQCVRS